jgi:hypothetical protein
MTTDTMSCVLYYLHLGIGSILALRDLLYNKNASTTVHSIVATHLFTDEGLVHDMQLAGEGSVEYVMCEMKRILLKEQVIEEVKEMWHKDLNKVDSTRCQKCKTLFFYEETTSSKTCRQCGLSVDVLENSHVSFAALSRYNRNARHVYAKHEHFFQTLLDMTCMSKRRVSLDVVNYCKAVLGRGKHITFQTVFKALQTGGYTRFYNIKYEIAARLRGGPEIVLSMRETEQLRGHYRRYDACFYEFQVAQRIGNRSCSGRLRLYWPVRFVMVEMFKLIDRHDLIKCVKPVSGPHRLARYIAHWKQLKVFVDKRKPIKRCVYEPKLTKLTHKKPRISYSQYRQQAQLRGHRLPFSLESMQPSSTSREPFSSSLMPS